MDKGLDIGTRRALLALHPDCYGRHARRCAAAIRACGEDAEGLIAGLRAAGARADSGYAERALAWGSAPGRAIVVFADPAYPARLREIATPPPVLFVTGDAALLATDQIAIVGARRATRQGRDFARGLAADLAAAGLCITSGLALGIDGAAHRGALDGGGATLAVLGCGADRVYPRRHAELSRSILGRGALVSEFPLGSPPFARHFPMRNRVIAGLSLGTVVVEAAARSGSISTARHALEQGREVFAVPGSVNNPLARGCHALIRDGAKLTEDVGDVLEELPGMVAAPCETARSAGRERAREEADPRASAVLQACEWEPFTIDEIVLRTGLTPQIVSSMLMALELAGRVAAQAAGVYIRIR